MLERKVEIRHARGEDGIGQLVCEVGRVEIKQPHPVGSLGDFVDEMDNRAGPAKLTSFTVFASPSVLANSCRVPPVCCQVLRHQHGFSHFQSLNFLADRLY